MTTKRFNIFPNKTYAGYMEHVSTAPTGEEVFHLFLVGGDPSSPAEVRLMPGECRNCPTCDGCKLAWRQLHGIEVE